MHLTSSPYEQEPSGTADVLSIAKHEEINSAVTDAVQGHIRQRELFQRSTKSYAQYQEESTEPTDESSVEEKNQKVLQAPSYESLSPVNHTVGPGHENTQTEPFTSPENNSEQNVGPSILPIQLRTDRPTQTEATMGHSDYISDYNSDIEDKATVQSLPQHLQQEQLDELKSLRGISTEFPFLVHASVSQSPRSVSQAVTSLTTSGSYDGQNGASTRDKDRVEDLNLFTAAEQDKVLLPGLLQPDLTLSPRLAEMGDTWTEPVHLQGG